MSSSAPAPWDELSTAALQQRSRRLFGADSRRRPTSLADVAEIFSAHAVLSTGVATVDRMLRRAGIGSGGAGGLPRGSLTEVFGSPTAPIRPLLFQIVRAFVDKMRLLEAARTADDGAEVETAGGASWEVLLCLIGHGASTAGGWRHFVAAEAARLGPEAAAALDARVHLVEVRHPTELLDVLAGLAEEAEEPSMAAVVSASAGRRNRPHRLLLLEALHLLWWHPALDGGTTHTRHARHWYAAELRRRLQLRREAAAAGGGSLTVVISTGVEAHGGPRLPGAPPVPLGGDGWWSAAEIRLYVEPVVDPGETAAARVTLVKGAGHLPWCWI